MTSKKQVRNTHTQTERERERERERENAYEVCDNVALIKSCRTYVEEKK